MSQKRTALVIPAFFIMSIGLLFGFQNCSEDGFGAVEMGHASLTSLSPAAAVGNLGHRLTAPKGHIQYFGYYGSAMGGITDMTQVVSDHANMTWLAYLDNATVVQRLQQIQALNMKAIIDVQLTFFDSNMHLYPDFQTRWNQLAEVLTPYVGSVAAFYPMDEPYGNAKNHNISTAQMQAWLNQANAAIKGSFPNTPLAVIMEVDTVKNGDALPNGYDWLGFDCYGKFSSGCGKGIPSLFAKVKARLAPGQRTMLVPWAFYGKDYKASESDLITQANQYYQLAQDPSVIALVPFIYQQFTGPDGVTMNGVQSMPKLRQAYWSIGQQILGLGDGSNPPSYNVTGSLDGISGNILTGWACAQGYAQSIPVDLYFGAAAGVAGSTGMGRYTANIASEPGVASICQVGSGSYRFQIPLTEAQLKQFSGAKVYVYGISPILGANNLLGNGAGSFHLPIAASAVSNSSSGSSGTGSSGSSGGSAASGGSSAGSAAPVAANYCGKQSVGPTLCLVHYYCGSRLVSSLKTSVTDGTYVDEANTAYAAGTVLNTFTIPGYSMARAYFQFRCLANGAWTANDPNNKNNYCEVNKALDASDARCAVSAPKSGGGGGDGCFVAGTQVLMADGSRKSIETISVGDRVMGYDEVSKQPIAQAVTKLHHHKANDQALHEFHMSDGSVFTPNAIHPIFVVEQNSYFQAYEIEEMLSRRVKVSLQRADGTVVAVDSVVVKKDFVPVYNFEVEGLKNVSSEYGIYGEGHNYYAGGFLVHNAIYGHALGKVIELGIMGVPSFALKMSKQ